MTDHGELKAFTIDGLCRAFGIGRTKVYREIGRGALKVRKLGSRTLVLREDAEAWIAGLPEKRRTEG